MQYVFLDGAQILSTDDLHAAFARVLPLPDWYGNNLDALHDVLAENSAPVGVLIVHRELLREHLGRRAAGFFRLLRDLQEDGAVRIAVLSLDAPGI